MDSNQCILLRTQELPRSLILRKTPVLRHIFEAGFLLIFFHLSHHQRKYMKISSQRPTKRGEIELLDPGHVLPILCELRNLEAGFLVRKHGQNASSLDIKIPMMPKKEQTFSDEVGEFQNSWCELSSLLLLNPTFFQQAFRARGKSCIVSSPVPQPTCHMFFTEVLHVLSH